MFVCAYVWVWTIENYLSYMNNANMHICTPTQTHKQTKSFAHMLAYALDHTHPHAHTQAHVLDV